MIRKSIKKTVASLMAFVILAFGIMAYADSSFNTIFSGKLSFDDTMYMYFSESTAEMHCVLFKADAGWRFLNALVPSYYYLSKDHLYAEYPYNENQKENLCYVYSDGSIAAYVNKTVYVTTEDVSASFWFWGGVKNITVTYNGRDYTN